MPRMSGGRCRVFLKRVNGRHLPLPAYMTPGSSGLDLYAAIDEPIELAPLERALIPTGIAIALPSGYEAQVRPRSGLALKRGLGFVNSPGTIDSDYRAEIKVIAVNLSNDVLKIEPGERIAQLVVAPVARAELVEVDELPPSDRGEGGFGHTGT